MVSRAVFSSENINWRTPKYVYDYLDEEFRFIFDPCPPKPKFDGLQIEWSEMNFVNPPYSRSTIGKWIKKGIDEQKKKHYSVFLIPSRTDVKWFYKMFYHATEIRFIVRRINFLDENGKIRLDKNGNEMSAPFPSVIVFFGPKQKFTTPKISMMEFPRR